MRVRLGSLPEIYLFPLFNIGVVTKQGIKHVAVNCVLPSWPATLHCFCLPTAFYTALYDARLATKLQLKDEVRKTNVLLMVRI